MSEEIVRRLRNRSKKDLDFLKESLNNHHLSEAEDDEEEKDIDIQEPEENIEDTPEVEDTPEEEDTTEDEYVDPEGESEEDSENSDDEDSNEYVNPLDNAYAVKHNIGDEVLLAYSNGTKSKLKGEIDGYDKEGFYRVKWSNGMTTNGITDLALSDLITTKHESEKCVCGSTKFVNEDKYLVCDKCGRRIRESTDPLTLADKSRPKGKKLIRSEAHPTSTLLKPPISESIRKAFKRSMKESNEEDIAFYKLKELEGGFWTRLPELKEDIEDLGYTVDEINQEYVVISTTDDEDKDYGLLVPITGTSRTMTLDLDRARSV